MLGRLGTLLLGGALGAALAALLTPRTGRETQSTLRDKVRDLRDQYGDVIERGRLRATELVQSGQDMVNTAVDKARETRETSTPPNTERQRPMTERSDMNAQPPQPPQQP